MKDVFFQTFEIFDFLSADSIMGKRRSMPNNNLMPPDIVIR